jgi:hypothetical protein
MRRAVILGILLAVTAFAGAAGGQEARTAGGGPGGGAEGVGAQLRLLRTTPAGWELELTVSNGGRRAVYLMTDPVRAAGSRGPYLSVDPSDPSTLDLGVRLYPKPEYTLYADNTMVTLERLEPGASRAQRFTVAPPAEETLPPYPKGTIIPRPIRTGDIKCVRGYVGVLPDEEGVRAYLRSKEGVGPYADGDERLEAGSFKGKLLIDLQTLVSTEKVALKP